MKDTMILVRQSDSEETPIMVEHSEIDKYVGRYGAGNVRVRENGEWRDYVPPANEFKPNDQSELASEVYNEG